MCWGTDDVLVCTLFFINLLVTYTHEFDRLDFIFGLFLWSIFVMALTDFWTWALVRYTL